MVEHNLSREAKCDHDNYIFTIHLLLLCGHMSRYIESCNTENKINDVSIVQYKECWEYKV